ncbi:MAG: histidine kinase [Pseudomonadota bacterium]
MRRMWQIYGLAWVVYACLIAIVLQIDDVTNGRFNFADVLLVFVSILPAPLLLSLVWPLTGYLERNQAPTGRMVSMHLVGALAFSVVVFVLNYLIYFRLLGIRKQMPLARETWPFLYNLLMYGVVAGAFHGVRSSLASRRQALAISQAQMLLTAAELTALRNKLNPHFLFNTLHSIIALVRKDAMAAEAALFHFSDMLRYILDTEKSGNDRVMLDDELQFVRDYLDLEALRLGARLQVHWDIDARTTGISLPALSIQPLVENSIKHAFNPRSQPGKLSIRSHLNEVDRKLEIVIADDGPGAENHTIENAGGMGIKTVERRLKLAYGEAADFQINTSTGLGFSIKFTIPLQSP